MPQRIKMVERDPNIRNKDFEEVNLGYSDEQALTEAKRCLHCKNPMCVTGCPVEVNIPEFVHELANNNPAGAIKVIKSKSNTKEQKLNINKKEDIKKLVNNENENKKKKYF